MEEQRAHELYTEFAAVDAGARFKQGIGFAGRGAPKELQGWADKDDDDVIARNRRLFGGDRGRQDERRSPEYDSDTAEAVQRRLRELKREQQAQQPEGAAPLPGRLYDEQRERRQQRLGENERAEPARRRSRSRERRRSRSRERRRSWSRERRRSRSRSREGRHHHHRHSDSHSRRQRSRSRERGRYGSHHRSERRHSRSRSRDRRPREERRHAGGGPAAAGGGGGSGMQRLDFEALIPGYSAMTAAQRLKAKTQYLLERSEAKDKKQQQERGRQEEGGEQQQWTRFKFSAAAELEEQRLQPAAVYGPGEEGAEDVAAAGLGGLSAVTFKQSNAAAVQQERDDSHAAAIFGGGGGGAGGAARATTGAAHGQGVPSRQPHRSAAGERSSWQDRGGAATAAAAAAGSTEDLLALAEAEGAVIVPAAEVAAALQQPQPAAADGGSGAASGALSWREHALAAKRAKQLQ